MARPARVVIVGGGVISCATAYGLATAGDAVTVIERGTVGSEASSAAAGMLTLLGESPRPDPLQELALASWRLYVRAAEARCRWPLSRPFSLPGF
jgi:glycine oxidase